MERAKVGWRTVPERPAATPALPEPRPLTAPPSFHVLAKPAGPICNLDCAYCYFLAKEALYPGDRFRMADDVLETYVRQVIEGQSAPEATIAWQGGEPTLMGVDFFRRAIEMAERYRRPGQRLHHTIQTNGTLLTDEWCELLAEHGFLVGISIDGPAHIHDRYRVGKRGEPTFERVMRGADLLKRHGVDFNVLCTVNAANQHHPLEVYRFFRDELGAEFLQFIPVVERVDDSSDDRDDRGGRGGRDAHDLDSGPDAGSAVGSGAGVTDRSVDPEAWGGFLVAVFDEWLRHDVGRVFVQMFDDALASWMGVPGGLCIFAETCGDAVVVEHNGDLYSCDHFVEPEHRLGNIMQTHMVDLLASPQQRSFGAAKRDSLPRWCRECPVLFACHGECPKNRFTVTPDGEPGLNYLCGGYKRFFTHVDGPIRLMADMVRAGRPASGVIEVLARAPRNDPCPCGSGRKAKRCHAR